MNRLLGKKPKKEEVSDASAESAAPPTAVAYMRVLKDYSLLMEYKRLKQQAPTGIYVLPAADTLRRWYGVIFVRKGHYRGAIFKFCLMIPMSYPDEGPKVHFLSEVFHPLIHPDTGLLDLSLQFPTWSSNQHYIVLLLCYIKKIFYKTDMWEIQQTQHTQGKTPTVKEAMNPKAQNLWLKHKDEYLKLCERNALKSQTGEKLYGLADDAKQSIVFSKPRPAHDEIARRITRGTEGGANAATSYVEWFAEGVHKIDGSQMAVAGSLPSVLPPPPPSIHTTGANAGSAPTNLLGAMSPISPVLRAAAADAAASASGADSDDADDPPAVTLDQLAK